MRKSVHMITPILAPMIILVFAARLVAQQVILFKDGHQEKVKIISKIGDTLRYQKINEPGITRGILMNQVETKLPDTILPMLSTQKSTPNIDSLEVICPNKIFKTWIKRYESSIKLEAVLYKISESSVAVSNSLKKTDYCQGKFEISTIDIKNINTVKARRKGSIVKGALIGLGSGLVIGSIIGYIDWQNTKDYMNLAGSEFSLIFFPCSLAAVGISTGAGIGAIKIRFPIKGSQDNFLRYNKKLAKRTIQYNSVIKPEKSK